MSYKALYRSYRPQTFDEVAGQEHVVTTLKNAIKENRIAHAYLFAGPRGTGKTTVAKLLAKALNCTGDNPPCDNCPNCKAITASQHPDVIEIECGSGFCVDDYIEIKGNKENITLEYRDNIDVNIPDTYTLDITAVNKNGRTVEKSVTVKVVEKENKENGE